MRLDLLLLSAVGREPPVLNFADSYTTPDFKMVAVSLIQNRIRRRYVRDRGDPKLRHSEHDGNGSDFQSEG